MLYRSLVTTPIGRMLSVASNESLYALEFDGPERVSRLWHRFHTYLPGQDVAEGGSPVFATVGRWLDAYFASRSPDSADVPLDLLGTEFERGVWRHLMTIPPGQTSTYGAIAAHLGRADAARAVGAAVGANPVSLIVPCHRVVGADGSLTGYGGGLDRKEWLLRHERARGVAGDSVRRALPPRRGLTGRRGERPTLPRPRAPPVPMNAVDIRPIPPSDRRQPALDLFLIFACANIVATTFQTGASLSPAFSLPTAVGLIVGGTLAGSLLIAVLSALGARLGVPSVIAARAALGLRGAGLVAVLLYTTNFAWIAVNNVIAASACARAVGGPGSMRAWAVGLGLLSTLVVAGGPRLVARADRVAVPVLAIAGVAVTAACVAIPPTLLWRPATGGMSWVQGFDVVVGYQVSWILMFADYSRYTPSPRSGGLAVFLGLALTSLWLMPLGAMAARAAMSSDPGAMLAALHLGASGALLITVATVTTNFVNIYMSSLALRSLVPTAGDQTSVWSTGLIAAALSFFSTVWLERYSGFMLVLGSVLLPVGGILLARFFLIRREVHVEALYDPHGEFGRSGGFDLAGLAAWAAGGLTYYLARHVGGTLPSLAVSVSVYLALDHLTRRSADVAGNTRNRRVIS